MLICAAHLAECSKLFVNEWMLDVHRYSTACPNIWNHVLLSPHLENRHAPCLRIYSQYGVKMCIISQIHGFILFIFLALLSGFRLIRFAAKNLRIVENIIPSLVLTLLFFCWSSIAWDSACTALDATWRTGIGFTGNWTAWNPNMNFPNGLRFIPTVRLCNVVRWFIENHPMAEKIRSVNLENLRSLDLLTTQWKHPGFFPSNRWADSQR